jgi:TetR/AcrR family transcriptional regulator
MTEPTASDSKDAILDAAQDLIAQHGYAGFSIRDLSRESGLAKGTIYHHFQDKREIYRYVMERDFSELVGGLGAAVANVEDPVVWLGCFVRAYLRQANERRTHIRALLRELGAMEGEMRQMALKIREGVAGPVAAVIQRGIAQGRFRNVPPQVAVMALIGALNTYIAWQLVVDEDSVDESVADMILNTILYGLIKEENSNE